MEFPTAWLLPVLRDNLTDTELAAFVKVFLPTAQKLHAHSLAAKDRGEELKAVTYGTLAAQVGLSIWHDKHCMGRGTRRDAHW